MRRAAIAATLVAALVPAAPALAREHAPARMAAHGDRIPRGADRRLHQRRTKATVRAAVAAGLSELATGWCGPTTSSDDVVHQAAAGNAIKVVYARPIDVPDRFAQYAPLIQQAAQAVQNAFLAATGGAQSVRIDVGTACGANYLDIQSVVLPRTAAQYSASNATTTMSSDLRPLVGGSPSCPTVSASQCTRDFLVFADGVAKSDPTDPDYGVTGVATRRMDDRPTSDNPNNSGGQFAYVLGNGSATFGISPQTTAEHELLHNLGAVPSLAKHYSGNGHCYDQVDVMCYNDGGSYFRAGGLVALNCPTALPSTIDCGHDDYFNPDGNVYDDSGDAIWNIDTSRFLCAAASCLTGNLAPVAAFSPSPDAHAGSPVSFDASASSDEAAPPAAYSWDLDGDGRPDADGPTATHVYPAPGNYTVSLTVTDIGGAQATATRTVAVGVPLPPACNAPCR